MYDLERKKAILEILNKNHSVSVARLSETLFVSRPTVRRDLALLEEEGLIARTHGGAVLRNTPEREIPLLFREDQNNAAKQRIAERAAPLIRAGNVIFLDASSTVSYLIPHIAKIPDVTVITNSPKTSMRLGECGIKNYSTGGAMLIHSVAFVGHEAESFVANFNADFFFFSSRGYTDDGFVTDSSPEEAALRRAMLKQAKTCVYLADSSKRNQKYIYNICRIKDVYAHIDEL